MWGIVSNLTPTLSWAYPDATCVPEQYNVRLRTGPFFSDDLGGTTVGPVTNWTPSTPLEPGTEYSWGVHAMVGSSSGPFAGSRYFFTGPMCLTQALVAPILLEPADAAIVNDDWPTLIWDYPNPCLPEGYRIDLSTDPSFADTSLSGATGNPSTRWAAGLPLDDCQLYYWKVAPGNGTTLGPASTTRSFRIDVNGTCPAIPAAISGTVFHDLCGIPDLGPLPNPLPAGCVDDGGGSAEANGIFEPGEPGIADIVVRLGSGACPATNLSSIPTNSNGEYFLTGLSPGTYCVSVNALADNNDLHLIPGGWTAPIGGISAEIASWTVTVTGSESLDSIDFGWDYQFLPGWGEYAAVTGMLWHDLCPVPPDATPPNPLPAGCVLDGGVVHADGIRQPTEPGITGVVVDIGHGECPSAGLAEAVTDGDGLYTFYVHTPGDYCLRINAEGDPNGPILLSGQWTMVPSGHMGMTFRAISLLAGVGLPDQDFGWDFANLPLAFTPPTFRVLMNAHCRYGPSQAYGIVTSFGVGDTFPIGGISQDGNWVYYAQYGCYVAKSTGEILGTQADIPVVTPPPLPPTDTPQFSCSNFTDPQSCSSQYPYCEWYLPALGRPYCRNR